MTFNPHQARADRHDLKLKADALIQAAKKTGKDLAGADLEKVNAYLSEIKDIDARLERYGAGGLTQPDVNPGSAFQSFLGANAETDLGRANRPSMFPEVSDFILTGRVDPRINASLQEGSDLSVAIPPYQLENFRLIAPQLMPFELAGATVSASDSFGVHATKIPFILPGTTPSSTFAEGSGPSTASDCHVVGITLTPAKYAFLTKLSEEADADMEGLGAALVQEGISRVYTATEGAATVALKASLTAASATVALGTDNLNSLLNLEAAIPQAFANPSNALMLSRASLSRLRNTRDAQSRPIFDPINKTMLGYKCVLNDALDVTGHHYIVFGNWGAGAFVSYSQFLILRLLEAYREAGMIGIRFARRMASAFFSDASTGATQPLYLMDLGT